MTDTCQHLFAKCFTCIFSFSFTTLGNKGCIVHPIFQTMGLAIKDFQLLAKVTNV